MEDGRRPTLQGTWGGVVPSRPLVSMPQVLVPRRGLALGHETPDLTCGEGSRRAMPSPRPVWGNLADQLRGRATWSVSALIAVAHASRPGPLQASMGGQLTLPSRVR